MVAKDGVEVFRFDAVSYQAALPPGEYVVEIDYNKIPFDGAEGEVLDVSRSESRLRYRGQRKPWCAQIGADSFHRAFACPTERRCQIHSRRKTDKRSRVCRLRLEELRKAPDARRNGHGGATAVAQLTACAAGVVAVFLGLLHVASPVVAQSTPPSAGQASPERGALWTGIVRWTAKQTPRHRVTSSASLRLRERHVADGTIELIHDGSTVTVGH